MRIFFCLWQFLDLHHLRDFNLDIDQGKCNGLYAICQKFVDAGWSLNLVDDSLVIVLNVVSAVKKLTHVQYIHPEMNTMYIIL